MAKPLNRHIMREQHTNRRRPGTAYITATQRKKLIKLVGDSGTLLYTHYFDKAAYSGFDVMDDLRIANDLGWSARKVQKERLKLIKVQWVMYKTFSNTEGKVHHTYFGEQLIKEILKQQATDVAISADSSIYFTQRLQQSGGADGSKLIIKQETGEPTE